MEKDRVIHITSETENTPHWPEERVDLGAIRAWIGSVFPEHSTISGPVTVYRTNDWGVTARFSVQGGEQETDVVCKVGFLPIFQPSPAIYELLKKASPEQVPHLLASRRDEEQTWMLFAPFAGETVRNMGTFDSLLEMAHTIAKIQVATSDVINAQSQQIPSLTLAELPVLFDRLMGTIRTQYLSVWQDQAAELAKNFGLPEAGLRKIADLTTLERLQEQVHIWCAELQELGWPDSVDHIDLHTANAVIKPDGQVLIFDWEEAVISFPFLCLDRLLDEAAKFDGEHDKPIVTAHGLSYSPSQFAVRQGYLDQIPYGTRAERERAFDVAMCLQPIKYAYQGTFFLNQVGWQDSAPGIIAQSMIRAVSRWESCKG